MDTKLALKRLYTLEAISPDELEEFYVPRPDQPMQRLVTLLRGRSRQQKFFLVGQHGCGKTTELNRLARDIAQDYEVVRCGHDELRSLEEPVDVEFLFLLLRTFLSATKRLDPGLNRQIEDDLRHGALSQVQDLDLKLSMMGMTISDSVPQPPRDVIQEATIRDEFKIFRSELFSIVTDAIKKIGSFTFTPVLLIIDDMEKLAYAQVRKLLTGHSHLLSSLPCAAIYTVPLGLLFDGELLLNLRDNFHDVSLANVPLVDRKKEPIEAMLKFLYEVIGLRIGMSLFTTAETRPYSALFQASGGNLRQCLRLVGSATLFANQDDTQTINVRHAQHAIQNEEKDYRRMLTFEEREVLKQVFITKEYHRGMPLTLLGNLSVLEYWHPDHLTWYDVNPLVIHLISKISSLAEISLAEESEYA
jgi:Cdc6-like AAA superfamily ATPase